MKKIELTDSELNILVDAMYVARVQAEKHQLSKPLYMDLVKLTRKLLILSVTTPRVRKRA